MKGILKEKNGIGNITTHSSRVSNQELSPNSSYCGSNAISRTSYHFCIHNHIVRPGWNVGKIAFNPDAFHIYCNIILLSKRNAEEHKVTKVKENIIFLF